MDRVYESGAVASPPTAPVSPSSGYPSPGDAVAGVRPTVPGPWWFHQVTEELCGLIEALGGTLDGTVAGQLAGLFKNKVGTIVGSLAELRALDKTKYTHVLLVGYYAAGDAPLREFHQLSSGTENGITVIVAADDGIWGWTLPAEGLDVRLTGAKGDGSHDDTAALNAAHASGIQHIHYPDGNYSVSGPIYYRSGQRITFGPNAVIVPTAISGWTIVQLNGVDWGYGIFFNQNWQSSTLDDVDVVFEYPKCKPASAWNGHFIVMRRVQNGKVLHSRCENTADVVACMYSTDILVNYGWCQNISNCAYDFWESVDTVYVKNCKGYTVTAGINFNSVSTTNAAGNSKNCYSIDNSFHTCSSAGVFAAPLTPTSGTATLENVQVVRTYVSQGLAVANGTTTFYHGITMEAVSGGSVKDCVFSGIGTNSIPVNITKQGTTECSDIVVEGNTILDSTCTNQAYIAAWGARNKVLKNKAINSTAALGIVVDSPTSVVWDNVTTGATTAIANQDQSGTSTAPALQYDPDGSAQQHHFKQTLRTDGAIRQNTSYAVTATGLSLADALALTTPYTFITGGASGTGCSLPDNTNHVGEEWFIQNNSGSNKVIYAASGQTIGGSASITLATSTYARFIAITPTLWLQA